MPAADHPVLAGIPLYDPAIVRRMGLIVRKGRSLTPAAERLYELMVNLRRSRTTARGASRGQG
jgi:hypothetical protein